MSKPISAQVSDGSFKQFKSPLGIFPEEIWLLIFDKITDPSDLENLNNVSPFFKQILYPKRVLFLFPKVWNIMAIKYHTNYFKKGQYNLFDELSSPSPHEDLVMNRRCGSCWRLSHKKDRWYCSILKLRQVCTAWNIAVDNFYQSNAPYQNELIYRHTIDWSEDRFGAECQELRLSRAFLNHFGTTHGSDVTAARNPFVSRAVVLVYGQYSMEFTQEYLTEMRTLLTKYGHHIWHCRVYVTDSFQTRSECYSTIRTLLELMSNLKVLHVSYKAGGAIIFDEPSAQDLEELASEVNLRSPPSIESLQCLKTSGLPTAVFNKLISCNSHVSTLEIGRWKEHANYDIYTVPLPNLKQLSVEIFTEQDFQKLEHIPLRWSLRKLKLEFQSNLNIEWSRVFRLMEEKWASTLTELELNLPSVGSSEEMEKFKVTEETFSLRLNLPGIKKLKLGVRSFSYLDIILPMRNQLESLDVSLLYDVEKQLYPEELMKIAEKKQVIQFHGYFDKLPDSNIWNLFPNLNRIWVYKEVEGGSVRSTKTRPK